MISSHNMLANSAFFLTLQSGALNATPTFGPLAIPVFLDKLTAGSRATKVNLIFSLTLYHTEIDHRWTRFRPYPLVYLSTVQHWQGRPHVNYGMH